VGFEQKSDITWDIACYDVRGKGAETFSRGL